MKQASFFGVDRLLNAISPLQKAASLSRSDIFLLLLPHMASTIGMMASAKIPKPKINHAQKARK